MFLRQLQLLNRQLKLCLGWHPGGAYFPHRKQALYKVYALGSTFTRSCTSSKCLAWVHRRISSSMNAQTQFQSKNILPWILTPYCGGAPLCSWSSCARHVPPPRQSFMATSLCHAKLTQRFGFVWQERTAAFLEQLGGGLMLRLSATRPKQGAVKGTAPLERIDKTVLVRSAGEELGL